MKRNATQCTCRECRDYPGPLAWMEECPGGVSTIILLVCFAAGMWGAWQIWKMVK
jgi:hypothetical protein